MFGCTLVGLVFILFSFPDLARLVDESSTLGQEVYLEGSWPMTAMIWTASNLEAQGRLFDVPLPVTVLLSLARSVPVGSGSSLPQVVTHPATPRPDGGYRQDLGSFGEFVFFLGCAMLFLFEFF